MASSPKPSSISPSISATATVVGNTFVNKYYNMLHQSPDVVHRFYTDRSILSRAEAGPNGAIDIVVSQAGIDQKIMSLDYRDFRAEIKTVDSLQSLNGSVLVMVTGSLSSHGRPKRNFVQTFFLAPQEVGYFVLNDMFRYLDGEPMPVQFLAVPMANGGMDQHVKASNPVPLESLPPQPEVREYATPSPEEETILEEPVPKVEESVKVEEVESKVVSDTSTIVHEVVDAAKPVDEMATPITEEPNAEEAPKKSYASILRLQRNVSGAGPTAPAPAPASSNAGLKPTQVQADVDATQDLSAVASSLPSNGTAAVPDKSTENTAAEPEGDGLSVYVRNLPPNILASELEEEFKKFGAIKSGGINLRNQRIGVCFAFIEYEEASSAQKAIQASPIDINGRKAYIEEKKTLAQRSGGRGRFNQGRGYQHDSTRGRGYFVGREFARGNGQDFDREMGRGNGAGRNNHTGGNATYGANYGSNFNTVNGYRRADNQGWNGPRSTWRGSGNQTGHGQGMAS